MAKILDTTADTEVGQLVLEALEDVGFEPEEAIPGLVNAIIWMAERTNNPEQALDEAANLLADSGRV